MVGRPDFITPTYNTLLAEVLKDKKNMLIAVIWL
jgi:hypothetical protein